MENKKTAGKQWTNGLKEDYGLPSRHDKRWYFDFEFNYNMLRTKCLGDQISSCFSVQEGSGMQCYAPPGSAHHKTFGDGEAYSLFRNLVRSATFAHSMSTRASTVSTRKTQTIRRIVIQFQTI
mmetsp:Transcript_10386/g.24298  ORF Transcript_10386/g.24298 Transcript_10386/m.24298 type:complete len:123 (-) Transcript_10386:277-645(-)